MVPVEKWHIREERISRIYFFKESLIPCAILVVKIESIECRGIASDNGTALS